MQNKQDREEGEMESGRVRNTGARRQCSVMGSAGREQEYDGLVSDAERMQGE